MKVISPDVVWVTWIAIWTSLSSCILLLFYEGRRARREERESEEREEREEREGREGKGREEK